MKLLTRNATVSALGWSLPSGPSHCAAFQGGPGSVCASCYAGQGMLGNMPAVLRAQATRAAWIRGPGTVASKARQLASEIGSRTRYMVVHVSGDFRDRTEVLVWKRVAQLRPDVRFWVRTRTWRLGRAWVRTLAALHALPNVVVRASALAIDGPAPAVPFPTSGVTRHGVGCPKQTHGSCAAAGCRACWDKDVPHVDYLFHSSLDTAGAAGVVDWTKYNSRLLASFSV